MTPFLARAETPFLVSAIMLYLGAMLLLWSHLLLQEAADGPFSRFMAPNARAVLLLGAGLQALSLIGQGRALFMFRAGVVGLFGWTLIAVYLGFTLGRNSNARTQASFGAFVTPLALLAALYSLLAAGLHRYAPTPSALEAPFWIVHVVVAMLGYVALAFAFAASLIYLVQEGLLKRKKLSGLWRRLPSLSVADAWIARATSFGVAMLSLGIATGAAWYSMHPPTMSPFYDPKVTITLATWLVFAMYLVARGWLGWRGRRTNLVVVCGFVLLAISFLGTPHLLGGATR